MTARPYLDERDPLPPREWQPASHEWARRAAREAAVAAVRKSKDARTAETRNATTEESTDE